VRRAAGVLLLLLLPRAAGAAEVAVLKSSDTSAWRPALEALRRVTLGHELMEYDLKGDAAEAARLVAGLRTRVAAIVAFGPLAARAARENAPETPLVVCMVQDPASLGLLPGPGVTGVAFQVPVRNQLAAFRLVHPRATRLGVIYGSESVARLVQEAERATGLLQLSLVERRVTSEREVPAALRTLLAGSGAADALWLPPDPLLLGDDARRHILAETLKAGKAVLTFSPVLVGEGALASLGPDMTSTGEQTGELVNRILGPEKGARIDFLVPRGELVINRRIAERLRIEIAAEALKAASKVF
jgi:putative tryptophan/tyrosine transport system substrate-binding protein